MPRFEFIDDDNRFELIDEEPRFVLDHPISTLSPKGEFVEPDKPNKIVEAIAAGAEQSILGKFQKKPVPYEPKTTTEGIAMGASKLLFDMPFYVLGGAMPGGPVTSFMLPAGLESLADVRNREDKDVLRAVGETSTEMLKAGVVGGALGVAGAYRYTSKMIPASVKKFFSEVATLTVASEATEGQPLSAGDFITNTIFLGGLKGFSAGLRFLSSVRNEKASKIAKAIQGDKEKLANAVKEEIQAQIQKEGAKQTKGISDPQKLANAVGKPDEVDVLVKGGVVDPAEQVKDIVRDSVTNKAIAAKGLAKKHPDLARKYAEEAYTNGEKIKGAGGADVKAQVDAELSGVPKPRVEPVEPTLNTIVDLSKSPPTGEGTVQGGGLRYGEKLPERMGKLNITKFDDAGYDVQKFLVDTADQYQGVIKRLAPEVTTHEMTRLLADSTGMSERKMGAIAKRYQYANVHMVQMADLLLTSADEVTKLAKAAVVSGMAEKDFAAYVLALERHARIQGMVTGFRSSMGRGLEAGKIHAKTLEGRDVGEIAKGLKQIIEANGGREFTEYQLTKLAMLDLSNPQDVASYLGKSVRASTREKIFKVWMNFVLSAPVTHIVNDTSNALVLVDRLAEKTVAAALESPKALVGAKRDVTFGEAFAVLRGSKEGVRAGLNNFLRALKTGESTFGKIETIKGPSGNLPYTPVTLLMAEDEFFKAINYSMSIHSQAYREGAKAGLKGQAKADLISRLITEPSAEMTNRAYADALYYTFNTPMGRVARNIARLRQAIPGSEYIVPFIRTPANIAKFSLERTPANLPRIIMKKLATDRGKVTLGAKPYVPDVAFSEEISKVVVGSAIAVGLLGYILEDRITGSGPKDPVERSVWLETHKPYSILINGEWYSWRRLEPLSTQLGAITDFVTLRRDMKDLEAEEIAARIAMSFANILSDKVALTGITRFLDAMTDPKRYGERWVETFARSLVPRAVTTAAQALDPVLRKPQGMEELVKSQIPGLSTEVPARRNLVGDKIEIGEGGFLELYLSPVRRGKANPEWWAKEVNKRGVALKPPTDVLNGYKLTPDEYDELQVQAGAMAKTAMNRLRSNSRYINAPDEDKGELLRKAVLHSRKIAKERFWRKHQREIKLRDKEE